VSAQSRERFRELVRTADPDLAELNLLIAIEAYPKLEVARWLDRVDTLAADAAARGGGVDGVIETLRAVGLTGDHATYDDPRNSYLPEVLDRRSGLPITLSVLTVAVARRLGLDLRPVAMPGHVIVVDMTGLAPRYLDPFDGWQERTMDGCAALVTGTSGLRFDEAYMEPTPVLVITRRMLANLSGSYLRREAFDDVRWTLALAAIVDPDDPSIAAQLRALDDLA
jgi:regulator of sirC expression with transglutaminase-like and TPR domain